jgi:thioredoxin-dependent peroxiredoxin
MALAKGDKAPDFKLPDALGNMVSLSDLKGKKVVLYGAVVLGMSPDSSKSHGKFAAKHELKVGLVADEDKTTLQAYGVWAEKSMYGRKYMGVERSTFLIGEDGTIREAWRNVKVPGHAEDVLKAVKG